MNMWGKGASTGSAAKATLNPNAAEFVPSTLWSPGSGTSGGDASSKFSTSTHGRAVLDRSESSISNKSDEEAQQYWEDKLPSDLTPDFKVMAIDDTQGINSLVDGTSFSPVSSYREYQPSMAKPWDRQIPSNDQVLARVPSYNGNSRQQIYADVSNEQLLMDSSDGSSLKFLASKFPGFAAEILAEVLFVNGGDLNLAMEMLTQLELKKVDGGLNQALNSKASSALNFSALDFPALSGTGSPDGLAKFPGDDLHRNMNLYQSSKKERPLSFRSSSFVPSRGATDFASAVPVRTMPSQESSIWKYEQNGSLNPSIGSSRSSQVLASSYNSGQGRGIYGDRLQNRVSAHGSPVWLGTGEAVGNMYSEMREEARDYARVRNAYFEQARQAYLIGNKVLAEELSIKGKLYNMQMKLAAQGKGQDSIFRQRNPNVQASGREQTIDLQGLHVSEAIHVLKLELAVMKNAARSTGQRLLVYICIGTGHHTRGSHTQARLPTAVERYLLEEEGLDFSEPQPGLLRVVIY
ncbi:hypothetical protein ACJIZ3_023191 [Penstemon smallii]|uniref:Smr domain-containing protein n=1 Tax=Penstemon smallii TaxID=265156 RepID=A0ABD3TQQ4_9LAMI